MWHYNKFFLLSQGCFMLNCCSNVTRFCFFIHLILQDIRINPVARINVRKYVQNFNKSQYYVANIVLMVLLG